MPHKRSKKSVRDAETAKKGKNLAPSDTKNPYDDTPRGATRIFTSIDLQTKFRASGRTNSEDTGERRGLPGTGPGKGANANVKGKEALPKIMPQETLGEYNRRIESLLRPAVSSAIKTAENQRQAEVADERRGKKERKRRARLEKLIKEGKVDKKVLEEFEKSVKEKKRKREQGKGGDSESEEEEEERGGKKQKQQQKEQKEFKAATSTSAPRRLNDIAQAPPSLPQLKRAGEKSGVYGAVSSGKMPLNAGQKRIMEEERERVINLYREMKAKRQESKSS